MQEQDRTIGRSHAFMGSLEMPCKDWHLVNSPVRKEAISRFGVGPILTGQRNRFSKPTLQLPYELLKPPTQPGILKPAAAQILRERSAFGSPNEEASAV